MAAEKLRVFLGPRAPMSRAMDRVSAALRTGMPAGWTETKTWLDADLELLHVIGPDAADRKFLSGVNGRLAAVQYCTNLLPDHTWEPLWRRSSLVWSYYRHVVMAAAEAGAERTMLAPLGIDDAFKPAMVPGFRERPVGVVTTGYVSGPGAEAIEEAAWGAHDAGYPSLHVGPRPVGMKSFPPSWRNVVDVSDEALAEIYMSARFVSGLRWVEGFELPAFEGASCGAVPLFFRRADSGWVPWAWFVKEGASDDVRRAVRAALEDYGERGGPPSLGQIEWLRERFDWKGIAKAFWAAVDFPEDHAEDYRFDERA